MFDPDAPVDIEEYRKRLGAMSDHDGAEVKRAACRTARMSGHYPGNAPLARTSTAETAMNILV